MFRVIILLLLFAAIATGQTPSAAAPDPTQIAQQFGPMFTPLPGYPVLTADLDGDGFDEAVMVATAENPLLDELAFHYKVIDPYSAFFGFGDPKVTTRFAVQGEKPRYLLVVHNWRDPRAKFVILNIPFEKLSISRVLAKKKTVPAIRAEEVTGMRSALYWDGKKWKWKDENNEQ
jgi:hypothetical protein